MRKKRPSTASVGMEVKSEPPLPLSPSPKSPPLVPSQVAGISYVNTLDDRITSKVERMAAMVDDKTLISSLIRENSNRISLIEFKDARADIWQHFRLVQLDGQTLAYAVCVRCLKPVSYKAREGTGGLHRHPCSKAAAATGFLPDGSPAPLPPLAVHPLLANCKVASSSTSSPSATAASSSSSSKRKDILMSHSNSHPHHNHHRQLQQVLHRGSSSGISSKGSSLSSPSSSSSSSSSPPAVSPLPPLVPDAISSSTAGRILTYSKSRSNTGPSHRQNTSSSLSSLQSYGMMAMTPSSSVATVAATSSSSSNNKINSKINSIANSRQRLNHLKTSSSIPIPQSPHDSNGRNFVPSPSSSPILTQQAAAVAAVLNGSSNGGNSSLSNLSSIMSPFLLNSLNNAHTITGQQQQQQQQSFNFMWANGSLKTDCQAMVLLSDSKSPSFHPVTEQMTDLYERSVLLDVTLVAKNGCIKVHKLAIAAASIVFEEALTVYCNVDDESACASPSSESAAAPTTSSSSSPSSTVEELDLKEYDLSSVRAMVEFVYYGELNDTETVMSEVLRLAEYYEIRALKFACAQRLYRNLTPENAIEILAVAEKCNCEELKQLIPAFIAENASRVTSTNAWRETFKDRSDLVANLLGVTATDLSMTKKRKTSTEPSQQQSQAQAQQQKNRKDHPIDFYF